MARKWLILLTCLLGACAQARVSSEEGNNVDASNDNCAPPLVSCEGECVNTDTDEANCGECGEICDGTCVEGGCVVECVAPRLECQAGCIDPSASNLHCGATGDCLGDNAGVECPENFECQNSNCVCVGECGDTFEAQFQMGTDSLEQCTQWENYLSSLSTGYGSVTMFGSEDPTGITCADPAKVAQIRNGIVNNTEFFLTCDGHTWSNCNRRNTGGNHDELWVDAPSQCDVFNCPEPGYLFRICSDFVFWGGVNTATCSSAPSQTMGLRFQ